MNLNDCNWFLPRIWQMCPELSKLWVSDRLVTKKTIYVCQPQILPAKCQPQGLAQSVCNEKLQENCLRS